MEGSENENITKIPHIDDVSVLCAEESSYEFQFEKILDEIKKINKLKPTVCLFFKALPDMKLLEEVEKQGYDVKFDAYYDSVKSEKFNSKVRITNPKFNSGGQDFVDKIEDQLKNCAYSQSNFQVSEEAKSLFDTFMGSFGVKN